MSKLTDEIKTAQRKTAENVILLDLRKKGLVEDNHIIKRIDGKKVAKYLAAWLSSDEGKRCMGTSFLYNPAEGEKYLKNRMEAAFLAGVNAAVCLLSEGNG